MLFYDTIPYGRQFYISPSNHIPIQLPRIFRSRDTVPIYGLRDLFSRLLCAYICIDLLGKCSSHWTVDRVLHGGGFTDVLKIMRETT